MLANSSRLPSSFAESVFQLLEHTEYRRADTEAELDAILRLRHDAFVSEGQISPKRSGRLPDNFDQSDNVYNLGVYIDGELAGAIRLHVVANPGDSSPAMEAFGEFLTPEVNAGKVILDTNRFVSNQKLSRLNPGLPYAIIRLSYMAARHFNVNLATMTVRAEHRAFYWRRMYAKEVCPPRPYPMLMKPICLLVTDMMGERERLLARHPYWASSEAERSALFGHGSTSVQLVAEGTAATDPSCPGETFALPEPAMKRRAAAAPTELA
jgi:N-acyl-L-homoserine lactone synthetase